MEGRARIEMESFPHERMCSTPCYVMALTDDDLEAIAGENRSTAETTYSGSDNCGIHRLGGVPIVAIVAVVVVFKGLDGIFDRRR